MNTYDWFFIAFCFLSCGLIVRMNVRLREKSKKLKLITMISAVIGLFLGIILLGEETLPAMKELIIYVLLGGTFFTLYTYLFRTISIEEREREERRNRCIR